MHDPGDLGSLIEIMVKKHIFNMLINDNNSATILEASRNNAKFSVEGFHQEQESQKIFFWPSSRKNFKLLWSPGTLPFLM